MPSPTPPIVGRPNSPTRRLSSMQPCSTSKASTLSASSKGAIDGYRSCKSAKDRGNQDIGFSSVSCIGAGLDCSGWLNLLAYGENRSEEHTSELQSLMRISYDVFFLKKKKNL